MIVPDASLANRKRYNDTLGIMRSVAVLSSVVQSCTLW
jgi:hypothetical protein